MRQQRLPAVPHCHPHQYSNTEISIWAFVVMTDNSMGSVRKYEIMHHGISRMDGFHLHADRSGWTQRGKKKQLNISNNIQYNSVKSVKMTADTNQVLRDCKLSPYYNMFYSRTHGELAAHLFILHLLSFVCMWICSICPSALFRMYCKP